MLATPTTKIAFCTFIAVCFSPSAWGAEKQDSRQPKNIILIMADDLGYETITANGGQSYQTPEIDRLAAAGARFTHCYSQPLCTPSRVQIMTGQYNVRNYTTFGELPRDQRTFAHLLKQAGYATCIGGKWQLGSEPDAPQHFGFEQSLLWQHTRSGRMQLDGKRYDKRYENPYLERNGKELEFNSGEYAPELVTQFLCDFITEHQDQPMLVYYPMILTHCPFVPTPDSPEWDPASPGPPSYKGDARYFSDMVTYMDQLVGRIADHVEHLGLADKTVILFTGDNGTDRPVVSLLDGREVAGQKNKTTDGGTHVPLVVHGAGVQPQVIDDLIDFSDFLPTLCDLAGIDPPADAGQLDGRSFLPQLQGQPGNPRDWTYCWYARNAGNKPKIFARTKRYKLYRDGRFIDVPADPLEQAPLASKTLTPAQLKVKQELQAVIDRYNEFRDP